MDPKSTGSNSGEASAELLPLRAGRWRVFESAFGRGWWGIEIDGDLDADAILPPQRIAREDLEAIVDAHNAAHPPQPSETVAEAALSQAALDVLAERQRQISAEGWTPAHDDQHDEGELATAAAAYAFSAATCGRYYALSPIGIWPWGEGSWKPTTPRRDLVKAGALILAEIERQDREEARRASETRSNG